MMMLHVVVAAKMFNKQRPDPGNGRAESGAENALKQCEV